MKSRRFMIVLIAFGLLRAPGVARAQDTRALESGFQVRFSNVTTSNLYTSSTDAQSATAFQMTLDGWVSYPLAPDRKFTMDLNVAQNDYTKFPEEDYRTADGDFEIEQTFAGGLVGAVGMSVDDTRGGVDSFNTLTSRDAEVVVKLRKNITPRDTASVRAWTSRENYRDYDDLDHNGHGAALTISHDLGGFSSVDASYSIERTHYPDEFLVAADETQTTSYRSDRERTFTLGVSRMYSLYPLAYLQVEYEHSKTESDSTGDYLWYDSKTGTFPYKVLSGDDNSIESALSVLAVTDHDENTTLSLYYLLDKVNYPNRLVDDSIYTEPIYPTWNTILYMYAGVQRRLNPKLTLELSITRVHSQSNESVYNYVDTITSLGLASEF